MTNRILVAGGSGFIGSHIVQELWKAGRDVSILCRDVAAARAKLTNIDIGYIKGDVRQPSQLAKALKDVHTLVSCVQFPNHPVENPMKGYTYEKVDGEGTRNLVAAAREAGVKRIVYLSGAGTREGRPNLAREPWFRGKLMAERAIRESGIPYTIFRPSWIYGREDHSLNRFITFARTLPFVPVIGDGRNRVQPLFILDIARAVVRAIDAAVAENETYELGGPQILSMDQIVDVILRVLGKEKPIIHHPVWFMKMAAGPLSLLPRPPLSPGSIDFIVMEELVDNTKAVIDLDLKLTPLAEALKTYVTPADSHRPEQARA